MKAFSLKKLKTKPQIIRRILWDWVPPFPEADEPGRKVESLEALLELQKQAEENAGYFFYIDVWEGKPSLLLKQQGKQVSEVVARIEEIPQAMLWEALEEQKESNPHLKEAYPITETIRTWLRQRLETESPD